MEEDGCRWKGHLERVSARQVRHERRLPNRRRIDLFQRLDDLVDAKLDLLLPGVPKRHRLARPNTRDRVVEGVHEHPAAEFAVGYDVESEVDLTPNDFADGTVLELAEGRSILLPLFRQDGRVASLVEGADRFAQCGRTEQGAHNLGACGNPGLRQDDLLPERGFSVVAGVPVSPRRWLPAFNGTKIR